MRKCLWMMIVLVAICATGRQSFAGGIPDEVSTHIGSAALVGKGSYQWLWFDAYHARLMAEGGKYRPNRPFALELTYRFHASGESIARKFIEEMHNQTPIPPSQQQTWLDEMIRSFPNISDGDRLVMVALPAQGISYFYHNGRMMHGMNDAIFLRRFFDIWLGEKASEAELRRALLGQ